jgi:hypothetical protein
MCPADGLRVDLVSTLRLVVDHAGEMALEGGTADIGRLVGAVEQLTKLLPPKTVEPQSHRGEDPRAALLKLILQMRERDGVPAAGLSEQAGEIAALKAENERLRRAAGLVVPHAACGAPPEVDVVPPSEIGEFYVGGPRPAPDDPPKRSSVIIEGKATAAPAAPGYDYNTSNEWKSYVNSDGSIRSTPRGSGHDWGPV